MKTFDETEELIIKRLVYGNGYARNIINIFDSKNTLQGTRIQLDKANNTVNFLFEIQGNEATDEETSIGINRHKVLTELLIRHLILLKFLEREALATFFDPVDSSDKIIEFGMGAINMPYFLMSISDVNIVKLLVEYIHKEIIPSPSLRKLVINNFKFDDEIRSDLQLKNSKMAWRVTLAVGFLSMVLGIYNAYTARAISQRQGQSQQALLKTLTEGNTQSANAVVTAITSTNAPITEYTTALNHVAEQLSKIEADIKMQKTSMNLARNKPSTQDKR